MSSINYFFASTKNEFLKLKGSYLFLIIILCALFIPGIYFLHYMIDLKKVIPPDGVNPWGRFFFNQVSMTPVLMSFFVVLVTSFIMQIEHRSSGIKHLFALPVPKWSIYFGKITAVAFSLFFSYALFLIGILLSGITLGVIHEELNFANYSPDIILMTKILFSSFTTIFGILALQLWLSFKIKNFMIPLGIGMVLVIAGIIVFRTQRVTPYFPYAYNIVNFSSINPENLENLTWLTKYSYFSILYFLSFSVLGYLNVSRANIK